MLIDLAGFIINKLEKGYVNINSIERERERETDRQTDRQTDRGRQRERETAF